MKIIEVTKQNLAKHINLSNGMITRFKDEGVLNGCFLPSGKIDLHKAIKSMGEHKGDDYLQFPKMVITPSVETINNLGFADYLNQEDYNKFIVDFKIEQFELVGLDKQEIEDFKSYLEDSNNCNMYMREFANCFGDALLPFCLDFAQSYEDAINYYGGDCIKKIID